MTLVRRACRCFSSQSAMAAWKITGYGPDGDDSRLFRQSVDIPFISRPNDVLIKVKAASLNPLDARMKGFKKGMAERWLA